MDPTGERTLGVVTKVDIAGRETDLLARLRMDRAAYRRLELGFVAIRNRSQTESAEACLRRSCVGAKSSSSAPSRRWPASKTRYGASTR